MFTCSVMFFLRILPKGVPVMSDSEVRHLSDKVSLVTRAFQPSMWADNREVMSETFNDNIALTDTMSFLPAGPVLNPDALDHRSIAVSLSKPLDCKGPDAHYFSLSHQTAHSPSAGHSTLLLSHGSLTGTGVLPINGPRVA